jgi:hypothetical protein
MKMKSFQSEIVRANRRKGSSSRLWGALANRNGGYFACVPAFRGSWRRQHVGGLYATAEEASKVAREAMGPAMRKLATAPHLNAYGEVCYCQRPE